MVMLPPTACRRARLPGIVDWGVVVLAACAMSVAEAQVLAVPAPSVVATAALPATPDGQPAGAVEDGLRQVLDDALAANLEVRAAPPAWTSAWPHSTGPGPLPAGARPQRALLARRRRARHRDPGRRPAEPGLLDAQRPAGRARPAAHVPARREPADNAAARAEQQSALLLTQPLYERASRAAPRAAAGGLWPRRGDLSRPALRARRRQQGYYRWLALSEAVGSRCDTRARAREPRRQREPVPQRQDHPRPRLSRRGGRARDRAAARSLPPTRSCCAQSWVNLLRNQPFDRELPRGGGHDGDVERSRSRVAGARGPAARVAALQERAAGAAPNSGSSTRSSRGQRASRTSRAPRTSRCSRWRRGRHPGRGLRFRRGRPYVLASLVLRFNLFRGGADRAAIREARAPNRRVARRTGACRAAHPRRGASTRCRSRGGRILAADRREARRGRRGRVPHRREEARPRPDQPGRIHRRAPRAHRRPAQPQSHAFRGARRAGRIEYATGAPRPASPRSDDTMTKISSGWRLPPLRCSRPCCRRGGGQPAERSGAGMRVRPRPRRRAARRFVHAVGHVAPRDEVRLSFKTGGVVASIAVDEGDVVREGQVLAVLEQAEVAAAVEPGARGGERPARPRARARALYADGVATEEQVQDLTTALRWRVPRSDSARVQRALHAHRGARRRRGDAAAWPSLANSCGPGQPVLVVGGDRARLGGPGRPRRPRCRCASVQGDRARITLDAFPGPQFAGRVTEIASAADPATGTFEMEILVDAGDAHFVQGLVAACRWRARRPVQAPASIVPLDGPARGQQRQGRPCSCVDPRHGVARRVQVTIGRIAGAVSNGARRDSTPGEQVVIEGAAYLRDGACRARHSAAGLRSERCASGRSRSAAGSSRWWCSRCWSAMGVASLANIPRAEDPSSDFPGAAVVVTYPGADPGDIEKLIVDPIEDAISELDDVKKLDSRSLDGVGIVDVEFYYGRRSGAEVRRGRARGQAHCGRELRRTSRRSRCARRAQPGQHRAVRAGQRHRELAELQKQGAGPRGPVGGGARSAARPRPGRYPTPEVRVAVELERLGAPA